MLSSFSIAVLNFSVSEVVEMQLREAEQSKKQNLRGGYL